MSSIIYKNYLKQLPGMFIPRGMNLFSHEPLANPLQIIEERVLAESEHYNPSEMKEIQFILAEKIINYAYRNVPFWKNWLGSTAINPTKIKDWSDFQKIPTINKTILKEAGERQYSNLKLPKLDFITEYTSGSTGEPFQFFVDRHAMIRRIAIYKRLVKRAGLTPKRRLIRFMHGRNRPGLEKYGLFIPLLSPQDIEKNRFEIYEQINGKECIMEAVASKLLLLAQLAQKDKVELTNLKSALPVSEGLSKDERRFIESVLKCPSFNLYAAREIGFLGSECEFKNGLHINSEALYLEILDQDGHPLSNGHRGRIVVTVFDNLIMPLIRYDTGDFGVISERICPCGRTLPLLLLEGRPIDYVDLPNNQKVHIFQLFRVFYQDKNVKMFQIIQISLENLKILIVPMGHWNRNYENKIKSFFLKNLPGIKKIDIDLVSSINSNPFKKRRVLIKNFN